MAENFQDNVSYGGSTLAVSGDAIIVGSTNAGAKSIIFNNTGSQGHLVWQPTDNRTISLPDASGVFQLTGQAPGAIAAGTQTGSSGTLVFSNSNGISFGMSNSSVVTASYTVPNTAGLISNINVSAGTTSNNLSALTFSNSNGLSFGLNGSTITGSYTVPTQTNQSIGLYGLGNTTQNSSTTLDARSLSFNGLGAATVGYSNGSIQISVPTQTAQTQSNIQAIYDGVNSVSTGTIRFSNSNGVSFGINGQTITGSVAAQTNQSIGVYAVGNTTGASSSTTVDARSLSFQGAGVASVGYTNGSVVISVPTGIANVNISAGTTSNNLTNFVFSNSNNVSFGLAGSTVTASITVPAQTNQSVGLYGLGNTTQNSSTTLDARSLSFNGLGAATVGYSNGSIQISAPVQTNQTEGRYAIGNTTGQSSSSTFDARTMSFSGAGNISLGYSGNALIISGAGGGGGGSVNISAGTTSNNLTNFVFSNSNGLSFGLSGSTITASISTASLAFSNSNNIVFGAAGATTITASAYVNVSAGTTSNNLSNFVFSNSNNVSFGISGSTVTASVAGGGGGSLGFYALGNTTQNSSTTLSAASLSFNGLGAMTMGYSNGSIQVSAPATSSLSATGNLSISVNGNTISLGVPNQTLGLYALGNTTQNSSSTFDARTMSFNGLGMVTVGYSGGSIQISATQSNQSGGRYALGNTTGQSSSSSYDARTMSFSGVGNISIGYSAGALVISGSGGGGGVALSAGTNSSSTGTIVFSNSNGISFGMNTNGVVTASVPAIAASNVVFSNANNIVFGNNLSTITASALPEYESRWVNEPTITNVGTAMANSLVSIFPFQLPFYISASNFRLGQSITVATNTTANSTAFLDMSISAVIYTLNGSTLSSIGSGSNTYVGTWASNATGSITGARGITFSCNPGSFAAGEYWMAVHISTTNTATGGANTTALGNSISMMVGVSAFQAGLGLDPFGAGTAASRGASIGLGCISTGATRATIAISDIVQTGTRAMAAKLWMDMRNYTIW